MTDDGYLEGFDSLLVDEGIMRFDAYPSNRQALDDASDVWAVARLRWFSRDFMRSSIVDNRLLLADLRMGQEPTYVFTHVVAARGNPHWTAVPTKLLPTNFDSRVLTETWKRIWSE